MRFRLTTLLGFGLLATTGMMFLMVWHRQTEVLRLQQIQQLYEKEVGMIWEIPTDEILLRPYSKNFGPGGTVRIRCPDLSRTSLYYSVGQIPDEERPPTENVQLLASCNSAEPGDYLLNVEQRIDKSIFVTYQIVPLDGSSATRNGQVTLYPDDTFDFPEGVVFGIKDPKQQVLSIPTDQPFPLFFESHYLGADPMPKGFMVWLDVSKDIQTATHPKHE